MSEQLVKVCVAKIEQDKLTQRRTVLSPIDQEFVKATAEFAEAEEIEVPKTVKAVADRITPKEKTEAAEEVETVTVDRPDPKATNDDLKAFMDDKGIEYETDDNKSDLNDKINAWVETQV